MVDKGHVPERGDVVWIDFAPQSGHEQAGRRPGLVVSPKEYNKKVGLALLCPITSKIKGYPFEVDLPDRDGIKGVILADQIKSMDWRARHASFASSVPQRVVKQVIGMVGAILEQE